MALDRFNLSRWQQAITSACSGDSRAAKTMLKNSSSSEQQDHQLNIYRNNFMGSRLSVIEQTFPLLHKLLGRDYLRQCGRHYICTSTAHYDSDLNKLGVDFPAVLQKLQQEKKELAAYPWLADLAQLDYLLHNTYYCTDDVTFDFNAFQQSKNNLDQLYFHCSNSIKLIESDWPIIDISEDINSHKIQKHYPKNKQNLCISRQNWQTTSHGLNSETLQLLLQLLEGLPMHRLLTENPNAQQLLPVFIQRGWICGFGLENGTEQVSNNV